MTVPQRTLASSASYWQASRAPRYSLLFALPLLVTYESLAALLGRAGGGVRNGADVLLQGLVATVVGPRAGIVLGAAIIGGILFLVIRDLRTHRGGVRARVFLAMAAESVVLALLFGMVVGIATAQLLGTLHALSLAAPDTPALAAPAAVGAVGALGWWTELMVSLGAGLYEELLFRVLLVSAIAWVGRAAFSWRPAVAGTVAVALSALIFSTFHYIGPYGDRLELRSFTFRLVAGLCFSALYALRGFGITAWTHALYDVFLLVA